MSDGFVDATRALVERVRTASRGTAIEMEAAQIERRLSEPLRVAIAGRVKAGKSTLLNALVRDRLAATDAGECTTVVTEYRHAHSYDVRARPIGERGWIELTARRGERLEIDVPEAMLGRLDRIAVGWPSSTLERITYIDTPGIASVQDRHSALTVSVLTPDDGSAGDADAVVYLLRHVHERDVRFLEAFMDRGVALGTPLNAIGLLSRADEIGAGRLDAIDSSRRIADRLAVDPQLRGLVTDVVPVAALLAETAATLTEAEIVLLRRTASEVGDDPTRHLASADRFRSTDASSLGPGERDRLLDRLGLFGIRSVVALLHPEPGTSGSQLVAHLDALSGVGEVRSRIESTFLPRATLLKARSALADLRRLASRLADLDAPAAAGVLADVERIESAALDFARFRVLHLIAAGATASPAATHRARQAAIDPASVGRDDALASIESLRGELESPLLTGAGAELVQLAIRLHEAAVASEVDPGAACGGADHGVEGFG